MELIKSMEWAGGGEKDAEKRERKFARAGSLPARRLSPYPRQDTSSRAGGWRTEGREPGRTPACSPGRRRGNVFRRL